MRGAQHIFVQKRISGEAPCFQKESLGKPQCCPASYLSIVVTELEPRGRHVCCTVQVAIAACTCVWISGSTISITPFFVVAQQRIKLLGPIPAEVQTHQSVPISGGTMVDHDRPHQNWILAIPISLLAKVEGVMVWGYGR